MSAARSPEARTRPSVVRAAAAALPRQAARGARRIPVTMSAVTALVVMGIVTGTLFRPADPEVGLLHTLSFGAPTLADGHWWTFLTGAIVLPRPEFYLAVGALLVLGVGPYERRVGALRTAVALIGTQLLATVATAAFLLPLAHSDWPWARALSGQVDLGFSAGALGIAGAASALLSPTWRLRVRAAGLTYLAIILFRSGLLWDVEHLLAFTSGVLAGPALAGRARLPLPKLALTAIRIRYAVAVLVACMGTAGLVETMYPGMGGIFGPGHATHDPMRGFALQLGEFVVFVLVADGLRRGRAAAWWLATIGTAISVINAVANTRGAIQIADVASSALVLAALLFFRNAFQWRTPDGFARKVMIRVGIAVVAFGAAWTGLIWAVRGQLDPKPGLIDTLRQTMSEFTFNPGPLRAHGGVFHLLFGVLPVAWALTLIGLMIPWIYADRGPDRSPRESLRKLLRTYGGGSLGWMRTWPAFTSWTTRDGEMAISYCVVGTVAIAIGDPVGPEAGFGKAVEEFKQFCAFAGWTPCWFAATPTLVAAADGWKATQIGEDTVIKLGDLAFVGKQWQDIRTARNRAGREGITMVAGRLADFPAELGDRIEAISREWVSQKALPEMGFTLGTVAHALDPEIRTHVALDADGAVQGVTTWLPTYENGQVIGWTLDLMRRRPDGFRPVMEYLIAESALLFQEEGYQRVSLSVAPLARRTQITGKRTMLDRTLDVLSGLLEPSYGFQSLLAFKAKFQPEFKPVYLVYTGMAELASISLAIGRAYLPNLDTRQAAMLLRGLRRSHAAHAGAH